MGWWLTNLSMVGDHPWHLSTGASFEYQVKVPNSKSVVNFLLMGDHPWLGGKPSDGW